MRRLLIGALASALGAGVSAGMAAPATATEGATPRADYKPTVESLESHPTPEWFKDAKFGIFIHWGAYSVPAWGPEGSYAEWYWRYMNDPGSATYDYHRKTYGKDVPYDRFIKQWEAEKYDPAAWVDLFERAGAKYFVLTSKHHEGVALFDSDVTRRDTVDMGPHRDLAGDLFRAARERTDLKTGFYYSLLEWYHPGYNGTGPVNPYTGESVPYTGAPRVQDYVHDHMLPQMRELIDKYDPDILWCDGEWTKPAKYWDLMPTLAYYYNQAQNRPDPKQVAIANRCRIKPGPERGDQLDFTTPEYEVEADITETKWESSRGIGDSYGYNRNEEPEDYQTSDELIDSLVDIVSKNGNLLLNIGPKADGTIPGIMKDRLRDIGAWLDINGEAIYGTTYWTRAQDERSDVPVRFTMKDGALYATALKWPGEQLTLSGNLPVERSSRITLLGGDEGALEWRRDRGAVVVTMPNKGADATASEHAFTFKITTPGVRQLVRPEVRAPDGAELGGTFTTAVEITNPSDHASADGRVHLNVPSGWTVEPKRAALAPVPAGEERRVEFTVTVPPNATPGDYVLKADSSFGRVTYTTSSDTITVAESSDTGSTR